MKLHWSPRSPFVRKVMIVAHETGLQNRFEKVRNVAIRSKANPAIIADSPVGRIPVLVLDDGTVLSGSYAICEYLDSLHSGDKLIPAPPERWQELELHGIADGLLDTLIFWRGEFMVPAEHKREDIAEACSVKTTACLDWLEQRAGTFEARPYGIGLITAGIVLDYLDFRFDQLHWRKGRPGLSTWHESFRARPSSQATEIVNDE